MVELNMSRFLAIIVLALCGLASSHAAEDKVPALPEQLAAPPQGFDQRRDGGEHGKLDTIEYDSQTVGAKRKALVYTPPGYSREQKYPVLYLLHGIGGTEREWTRGGVADVVMDNLYADKKAVPMIVVMPNGRADKELGPRDPFPKQSPAFAAFEQDLLTDLIPFIEKKLLGQSRPRVACPLWSVDGRRPIAELWPGKPRHVRLGWRLLLRAQYQEDRNARQRPRRHGQAAETPLGLLRRSRWVNAHQQRISHGARREKNPTSMAHPRWRQARLCRVENGFVLRRAVIVSVSGAVDQDRIHSRKSRLPAFSSR